MMQLDTTPAVQEIQHQLEWILSTKRFRNATNQSDFLSLVVGRAIDGKKTTGSAIAKELFPNKFIKLESSDVRVTARNLRGTLRKYYEQEGFNDLVVIRFPEPPEDKTIKLADGEAYTPEFSYNSNHAVAREFKLGLFYLAKRSHEDCNRAFFHFIESCKLVRHHYGAYIGAAEAVCRMAEWEWWVSSESKEVSIYCAATLLDLAQDRGNTFWRLHAVGGFMFTLNGNLAEATREFETSRGLNRMQTESYPPYFKFLVATGNTPEGVRLAKRNLDDNLLDLPAHVSYAETLIRAGQVADAIPVLENALNMDAGSAAVHRWLARIRVAEGRLDAAMDHVHMVAKLADELTVGLTILGFQPVMNAWPEHIKEKWRKRFRKERIIGFFDYALSRERSLFPAFERTIRSTLSEQKDRWWSRVTS